MKGIFYFHIGLLFLLTSCSTQKNTVMTRAYHNLTAYYNVYWNGKQAYENGMQRIEDNYRDNYAYVLPVFLYGIEENASLVSSEMQRAMSKATKCIEEHSIKAKPKKLQDKQNLTEEEREFYNQNEYNKWSDDAYLLVAKVHLQNMDYSLAIRTLRFMLNEFSHDEDILYTTYIWLARVLNVTGDFKESRDILEKLASRKELEEQLNGAYYKTYADFFLRQKEYAQGIPMLEKALDEERNRDKKIRYTYILSQLYQQTGQYTKASDYYRRVIRMNPPYEMSFNARLSRAFTHRSGEGNLKEVEQDLLKMLENENNRDFQDQIYYALGQLMYREGDINQAIQYYQLSSSSSVDNDNQKTTSLLAIADIYFDRNDYSIAGVYYDSVAMFMSESYPDYQTISEKTEVFIKLVRSLNTIALEDSLQRMAKMPEAERLRMIDQAIKDHIDKKRKEQQAERFRMQQMALQASRSGRDQMSAKSWYFYNPSAVARGKQEFVSRWGERKLEDNWRRKNKETLQNFSDAMTVAEMKEEKEKQPQEELADPTSRAYYLQDIPLSDSAMEESHARMKDAYMTAAGIYTEDLKDSREAVRLYEDFLTRYPSDQLALLTMYNLYKICREMNDNACENLYKRKILEEHPNSMFARVIKDPDYIYQLQKKQAGVSQLYEKTLQAYRNSQYQRVLEYTQQAHTKYADKTNHLPYFDYLKVLSIGQLESTPVFREALQGYITEYPQTEQAEQAGLILSYLDQDNPDLVKEEKIAKARSVYDTTLAGTHVIVMEMPKNQDANQLKFNLVNFHLDHFEKEFDIKIQPFVDERRVIIVALFAAKNEVMAYYDLLSDNTQTVFSELDSSGIRIFAISQTNLEILQEEKDAEAYVHFFREHYLSE